MANNILEYKGHKIGKSLKEDNAKKIIDEIFQLSNAQNCKIYYPEDVVVGKELDGSAKIKNLNEVLDDDLILDIGPRTIKSINEIIENSQTILWNGPAGFFENSNFAKGSFEIGKKIAEKNKLNQIFSVAGGGETIALLNSIGIFNNFNFVSTAGGAFLEYLEGKELPGIKALN
jgi:phosphoglycerate kinase